jgi:hypothetical protein
MFQGAKRAVQLIEKLTIMERKKEKLIFMKNK